MNELKASENNENAIKPVMGRPKSAIKTHRRVITMSESDWSRVDQLSATFGLSGSEFIRRSVQAYFLSLDSNAAKLEELAALDHRKQKIMTELRGMIPCDVDQVIPARNRKRK